MRHGKTELTGDIFSPFACIVKLYNLLVSLFVSGTQGIDTERRTPLVHRLPGDTKILAYTRIRFVLFLQLLQFFGGNPRHCLSPFKVDKKVINVIYFKTIVNIIC